MAFIVTLQSLEYGTEFFDYDTESEAGQGYERLKSKADKSFAEDEIIRTVTLVKDQYITG